MLGLRDLVHLFKFYWVGRWHFCATPARLYLSSRAAALAEMVPNWAAAAAVAANGITSCRRRRRRSVAAAAAAAGEIKRTLVRM